MLQHSVVLASADSAQLVERGKHLAVDMKAAPPSPILQAPSGPKPTQSFFRPRPGALRCTHVPAPHQARATGNTLDPLHQVGAEGRS